MKSRIVMTIFLGLLAAAAGCGDDSSGTGATGGGTGGTGGTGGSTGDGNVTININPEDTITNGIESCAGSDEEECISDGYSVSFSKYIITVGFVDMAQVDGANPQMSNAVAVAEFTNLSEAGSTLTEFNGIPIGQYTEFAYQTPLLTEDAENINGVSEDDLNNMRDNNLTYIIEGQITSDDTGDTLDFLIEANVESFYTGCGEEGGEAGINVSTSGTDQITMHGDHVFFNGFPADESGVQRLAEWMWLVDDTNSDGVLTQVDFEAATDLGTLYPSPPYSDLNAGPAGTLTNAWDFVRSQLGTQGHLNGEGECEWEF
ncbi:MAG: hypothetical protein AAF436_22355 [Myxococcota bacterium]